MKESYKLPRKNVESIVMLLVECLLILMFSLKTSYENIHDTMSAIGIMSVVCMIVSVFALFRLQRKLINAFLFFIEFAYLFSFGQCIMAIFDVELKNAVFSLNRGFFSASEIFCASIFVLFSIAITCIGYCLISDVKSTYASTATNNGLYEKRKHKIVNVGWFLLIISIIPTFYLLYNDMRTVSILGYGATLGNASGLLKICSLISGFFTSAILILYCFENKRRIIIYITIIFYFILQIVGGSRIEIFRLSVVFLLISELYRKELTREKKGIIVIIGLGGVFALSIVSGLRNYIYLSDDIGQLIRNAAQNLWENNFVVAAINEMGNTQLINTLVYNNCPHPIPYQFGLSFIKMLWAIIPNFIGKAYTGYIGVDITFSPLYTVTDAGMGASYISEGYWNFGYFSIIFFVVFGALFGWIEKRFNAACVTHQYKPETVFLFIYAIYYMVFLVRSESLGFGRSFVYYAIVPFLMSRVLWKGSKA